MPRSLSFMRWRFLAPSEKGISWKDTLKTLNKFQWSVFSDVLLTFKHLDNITCSFESSRTSSSWTDSADGLSPSISPFSNSTEAIYHPAEQIPTPVPLKTDLQFSVRWRCFVSLLYMIFPFADEQWLQGPSDALADRKAGKTPREPKSKRLFITQTYQALIKEAPSPWIGTKKRLSTELSACQDSEKHLLKFSCSRVWTKETNLIATFVD